MKIRFLLLIILILFCTIFFYGWAVWYALTGGSRFSPSTSRFIIKIASAPSDFYSEILNERSTSIKENKIPDGLSFEKDTSGLPKLDYILLSTINKSNHLTEIQLVNLSNNKILKRWQPDFEEVNYDEYSQKNSRIYHPIFYKNDIIFSLNYELFRLNSVTGKLVWKLKTRLHHSIELDADDNLWVCGTIPYKGKQTSPIQESILNDAIVKIDPESGKIIYQKSIYSMLIENGFRDMFFAQGVIEKDPIHLNDIQPALKDGKHWKKGDLLISIRHKSAVFLFRPSTNRILWLQSGPWLNQHDCNFINDHEIGIFGNDVYRLFSQNILANGYNNQYIYDFDTHKTTTPYTELFKKEKIGTLTEGRSRILPNGEIYVEETNYGRIIFGTKNRTIARYVTRLDQDNIAMLCWSRYYTQDELNMHYK